MRRGLVRAITVALILAIGFGALAFTGLLVPIGSGGTSSMAPTVPACDGRVLAEGFTYLFRDPRRGEIVAIHASGSLDGVVTPDSDARELSLVRRVVGVPGDQVVGRNGAVYVNGVKVDDVETARFARVDLSSGQFFVLGDNRSASPDSRDFGPVPRGAIFARAFFVVWPIGNLGLPGPRHPGVPPGELCKP